MGACFTMLSPINNTHYSGTSSSKFNFGCFRARVLSSAILNLSKHRLTVVSVTTLSFGWTGSLIDLRQHCGNSGVVTNKDRIDCTYY